MKYFNHNQLIQRGPVSSVGIAIGDEIFATRPDLPWDPTNLLYNGYRVFPGGKEWPGRDADPSPLLVPWSRKSRFIPLPPPLWAVRPVQNLSVYTRVHFTLLYPVLWQTYIHASKIKN